MNEYASTFFGKKVFITGHTGFKGSWLMAWLQLLGAELKGYALLPDQKNSLFSLLQSSLSVENVFEDVRDLDKLKSEIAVFQPDFIFHLAAQPLVRKSYEIPADTFNINVTGTANLLEAASILPGKCIIIVITTDKVYENKEKNILYAEEDQLGGYDPYSASKACAEIVVNSFRNAFFNVVNYPLHKKTIVTARAGNVIGGGDWNKDRIIPDIVRSMQEARVIKVRQPQSVRPWQHVLEPLNGYLRLAKLLSVEPLKYSNAYNFGPYPNDHLSVGQLVDSAIAMWGKGEWVAESANDQPHEAGLLKLSIERAVSELGWQPKLDAAKAVQWTIAWYKQPISHQAAFTYQQINDYVSL